MNRDLIKNPIILAILAAILTYAYMYWDADNKHKKNPKAHKRSLSLITPCVVGVVVWFLASNFFDQNASTTVFPCPTAPSKLRHSELSVDSQSYHLIGKNNVKLPPTDVFIDLAHF